MLHGEDKEEVDGVSPVVGRSGGGAVGRKWGGDHHDAVCPCRGSVWMGWRRIAWVRGLTPVTADVIDAYWDVSSQSGLAPRVGAGGWMAARAGSIVNGEGVWVSAVSSARASSCGSTMLRAGRLQVSNQRLR